MPQIRLVFRPSGSSCNHVHINDTSGVRLRVTTIADLRASVRESDDPLISQVKRVARDSGLTDPALLKTFIESRDFDF